MGVLGFILVAGGALTVWAGFQGVNVVDVVRSVLAGEPLPKAGQPGSGVGGALAGAGDVTRTPGTSSDDKPPSTPAGGGSPMEAK